MQLDDLGELGPEALTKTIEHACWYRGRRGSVHGAEGSFLQCPDHQPDQLGRLLERYRGGGDADIVVPVAEDDSGGLLVPSDTQVSLCPPGIREIEPTGKPLLHSEKYPPSTGHPPEVRKGRRFPHTWH